MQATIGHPSGKVFKTRLPWLVNLSEYPRWQGASSNGKLIIISGPSRWRYASGVTDVSGRRWLD